VSVTGTPVQVEREMDSEREGKSHKPENWKKKTDILAKPEQVKNLEALLRLIMGKRILTLETGCLAKFTSKNFGAKTG